MLIPLYKALFILSPSPFDVIAPTWVCKVRVESQQTISDIFTKVEYNPPCMVSFNSPSQRTGIDNEALGLIQQALSFFHFGKRNDIISMYDSLFV